MSETTELLKWSIIQWHIETSTMTDREKFVLEEILRLAHEEYITIYTGMGVGSIPYYYNAFEKHPLTDPIGCARVVDSMTNLFTDKEKVPRSVLKLLITFISTESGITSDNLECLLLQI